MTVALQSRFVPEDDVFGAGGCARACKGGKEIQRSCYFAVVSVHLPSSPLAGYRKA